MCIGTWQATPSSPACSTRDVMQASNLLNDIPQTLDCFGFKLACPFAKHAFFIRQYRMFRLQGSCRMASISTQKRDCSSCSAPLGASIGHPPYCQELHAYWLCLDYNAHRYTYTSSYIPSHHAWIVAKLALALTHGWLGTSDRSMRACGSCICISMCKRMRTACRYHRFGCDKVHLIWVYECTCMPAALWMLYMGKSMRRRTNLSARTWAYVHTTQIQGILLSKCHLACCLQGSAHRSGRFQCARACARLCVERGQTNSKLWAGVSYWWDSNSFDKQLWWRRSMTTRCSSFTLRCTVWAGTDLVSVTHLLHSIASRRKTWCSSWHAQHSKYSRVTRHAHTHTHHRIGIL